MTYRMQVTVKPGLVHEVHRDVAHEHPASVHRAMGTTSEAGLQRFLDTMNASDWYDRDGKHLGPDVNGFEMFEGDER